MTNLTGIPVLDVAIGLSFVYLMLSLLASAVQEWIAAALALRSRTLVKGLESMLTEDDKLLANTDVPPAAADSHPLDLLQSLYAHPLIRSLYKEKRGLLTPRSGLWTNGRLPSYLSPHTFALALTDILGAQKQIQDGTLAATIGGLPIPAGVKYRLLTLVREADNDAVRFRDQLEKWFDDTMARVSGWYKRQTQWVLLIIAVLVTAALNANSLTIGQQLYKDPTVRAAVVAQASSGTVTGQTAGSTATDRLNNAADNVNAVHALGIPLGWPAKASDPAHVRFDSFRDWVRNLLGWLLTIGAMSLGAPFWFDTLSRLSRLRSSGKPETPLPASSSGQPNERVPAPAATP